MTACLLVLGLAIVAQMIYDAAKGRTNYRRAQR